MGVRGLQTFIEENCPDACKEVSIEELAKNHKARFNVQPVLVIDGLNWLVSMYRLGDSVSVFGGEWLQFARTLQFFIAKFKNIGVKPIFIFDGTVCESKRKTWVARRIRSYDAVLCIFEDFKECFRGESDSGGIPTMIDKLCCFIVKESGADAFQSNTEADFVIAKYAAEHKDVFAILSQDSDYIIFNTKMYLSMLHFDFISFCTIQYDRTCLALKYLHLQVEQLPLFSCLVGNDIVRFEMLKPFLLSLCHTQHVYMANYVENLCNFIKEENWTGDTSSWREMCQISLKVFGSIDKAYLIHEGLKSYALNCDIPSPKVCIKVSSKMEKTVHERHWNCLNAPYIFDLLCKMEFSQREVLEDESRLPCAILYREIRQRCYGVLFNCFVPPHSVANPGKTRSGDSIIIDEWCAYQGNSMDEPEYVKPLPLKNLSVARNVVPKIEDLWFKLSSKEKLKVFWHILEIPMKFDLLADLPNDHIVLACTLSSLIGGLEESPLIQPLEVAVFVAQALWNKKIKELLNLPIPWLDADAVNLCTLFLCGVSTMFLVLSTCGSPIPVIHIMPWRYFDGKLFHHLLNKARIKPSVNELCKNQRSTVKKFYKLLRVVTSNSIYDVDQYPWGNVLKDFER
ncbi:constitutive coactivator of peroxisome proliferator-activated receptor gamma [Trichonephila inaurata madagascariensis]|uniref:Constitutive coactivator of peroxisome proliferator-activated receptor gamma n=1 Tax=Trichonephila inaurata madagascariensis TaxID=2747483 RepID=A0A8X6IQJ0_9ARAC|nr:constitutive coactivator of peroxisome proliferator-activated receptor gamma [Trichonephila inaurata madagascariensis]